MALTITMLEGGTHSSARIVEASPRPVPASTPPQEETVQKEGNFYIVDRRLYLTADKSAIVEERDSRARYLYAIPGTRIPAAEAEAYGLVKPAAPEAKAVPQAETQNKARKTPPVTKAKKG